VLDQPERQHQQHRAATPWASRPLRLALALGEVRLGLQRDVHEGEGGDGGHGGWQAVGGRGLDMALVRLLLAYGYMRVGPW
jgi:hypothetical protein